MNCFKINDNSDSYGLSLVDITVIDYMALFEKLF